MAGVADRGWKAILREGQGKEKERTDFSVCGWYGSNVFSSEGVEQSMLWV